MTCSIGIAEGSLSYAQPEAVLRDADMAMYHAKGCGRARFERYQSAMHTELVDSLELETDLRHAIENEELSVVYQPVIDAQSGAIRGFEPPLAATPAPGPAPAGG